MTARARGIRLPVELEQEIAREAEARGKSWSAATQELLSEAVRMRRAPGIVFADGPSGRRAVVAGSGLDVWEVVRAWKEAGQEFGVLRQEFPWLAEPQLRAALAYYQLYPEEIEARLVREGAWTPERLRREHPALAPAPTERR
jgi:uncharacterized protein (DUF433 family)